jgi:hypothetical protein
MSDAVVVLTLVVVSARDRKRADRFPIDSLTESCCAADCCAAFRGPENALQRQVRSS